MQQKLIYQENEVDYESILAYKHLQAIYERVHVNKFSFIGLVVGAHRVGKSLFCVTAGYLLDRTFWANMEKRVVYTAQEFLQAMNEIKKKGIKGAVVVWDEAGVGMPAREWYEVANKAVNYALQVLGYLHPILFFVTQDPSFLDSGAKKLIQNYYEVERYSNQFNKLKPFDININKKKNKVYYPYRVLNIDGLRYRLIGINLPKPPKEIEERYEKHSLNWKNRVMRDMEESVKRVEERKIGETLNVEQITDYIVNNHHEFEARKSAPDNILINRDLIYSRFKRHLNYRLTAQLQKDAELQLNKKEVENDKTKMEKGSTPNK